MGSIAKEAGTDVPHERIFNTDPILITQPGYVYIYLSNESPTTVEVEDRWDGSNIFFRPY